MRGAIPPLYASLPGVVLRHRILLHGVVLSYNVIQYYNLCFPREQMMEFFLFATPFRPALGPTQPPIQEVPEALSPKIKRLEREADNSSPARA